MAKRKSDQVAQLDDQVAQLDDQVAQLDDQVAQLDDQVAQLDDQAQGFDREALEFRQILDHERRRNEEKAAKFIIEMMSPLAIDAGLATLAAGALTGLLARRDSPCALNPQDIGETAAQYAVATLKALKRQQVGT